MTSAIAPDEARRNRRRRNDITLFTQRLHRLLQSLGISPAAGSPFPVASSEQNGLSRRMQRVQEYVKLHIGDVRAIEDLSEVAGLSRYHFARRFREEVGEPPWAFVRRVRAEHAHRLLLEGTSPVDAAHEAGFADQAHLTRVMRARFGKTPGQVRREGARSTAPDARRQPNGRSARR